jgi:serine phosphatase RsbU (regulator of sigma subunit)
MTATADTLPGDAGLMATCLVVEFDPATATMTACRAGHVPPLVRTAGVTSRREFPAGLPLGVTGSRPYEDTTMPADAPLLLVLFTDGLVERRDRSLDVALDGLAERSLR